MADFKVKEIGLSDAPAVYCGTYKKYNEGSLFGEWVTLTDFDSYDEFIEYCRRLHSDEDDPELMFQDYENFPRELYSEIYMGEKTFDRIVGYANHHNREALDAFIDLVGVDHMDDFDRYYIGEYGSEEDFAWSLYAEFEDTLPEVARCYFDIKAYARDLFLADYDFRDGYVFYK